MQQITKKIFWTICFVLVCQQMVWGFSLLGPVANGGDAWQTRALGYNPIATPNPYGITDEHSTGPKNLGEGYRRNTPVMYYTFDRNFWGWFNSDGTNAVGQAFKILNDLTNVSSYSADLSEFPLQSSGVNYQAQTLLLYDLKSITLAEMMQQLGLDDAVRYTWTIHDRWHVGTIPCPIGENYFVTERNFPDQPTPSDQIEYTPYVNGSLYTYRIFEYCDQGPQLPITAISVVLPVDPLSDNVPVSGGMGVDGIEPGQFYTGLTRDDVAGLRYLYNANNVNYESAASDSQEFVIHKTLNAPQSFPPADYNYGTNSGGTNFVYIYYYSGITNGGFGYGNLGQFLSFAQTNGPVALQAQYPGVVISSYTNTAVWASNEVYSSYYAVPKGAAFGTAPTLHVVTNYVGYYQPIYTYQFANVITNHYYSNSVSEYQLYSYSAPVGSGYGNPGVTSVKTTRTNQIDGDFFVLPVYGTNMCPLDIIDGSHFNVVAYTNLLTSSTTNYVTSTNTVSVSNELALVTYFTNYTYLINPTSCELVNGASAHFEGIENIKFVAVDQSKYDYINDVFTTPITNTYTMSEEIQTNGTIMIQNFTRVLTRPDFLFSAQDLTGPGAQPIISREEPNFSTNGVLTGLAGPGTIDTGTTVHMIFNKSGPVFYNTAPNYLNGPNYGEGWYYGSFDGTTNTPIIYANGMSITNLDTQVFIQITPGALPAGTVGQSYSLTFTVTGGQAPYTWSLTPDSSALPAGLSLSSTGVLSGTPQKNGVYGFSIQMNDSASHVVQRTYTLTIN